jgi:hypothetical protein
MVFLVCLLRCFRCRDKPDALKTDADQERAGNWVWLPDAFEAFVPAKRLETFYDGRVECEKEDGSVRRTWTETKTPATAMLMPAVASLLTLPLLVHLFCSIVCPACDRWQERRVGGTDVVFVASSGARSRHARRDEPAAHPVQLARQIQAERDLCQ